MQVSLWNAPATESTALPTKANEARQGGPSGLLHAANEFESMLLTQWFQAAESSFGSVPGGEDDQDGADVQMKSFAVQALAKGVTAAGGIGLSSLVAHALGKERADEHEPLATTTATHPAATAGAQK